MTRPLRLVGADEPAGREPGEGAPTPTTAVVRAAREGDVAAFATLVDLYYARCLRFALHMLSDRSDAEEAVQDTFVRLFRALPGYREQDAFEPWLFRILGNRCRSAGARTRRHAELVEYGEVPEQGVAAMHDGTLALREEIERALRALPTDQREAFLMRHVEGMSYEEMQAATGAGLSALKMRVKRACDAMRAGLNEVQGD